jgi:hypothetical protein
MTWKELIALKEWMPIRELPYKYSHFDQNIYKFEENKYFLVTSRDKSEVESEEKGPFLAALVWACSDLAVMQAIRQKKEKFENIILEPPNELLPKDNAKTYRKIREGLEETGLSYSEVAGYEWMKGVFVHRLIKSKMADYYFRERVKADNKMPYAITWSLKINRYKYT